MASLATAGIALGILGTGITAAGAIKSGNAAKANADFEATQLKQQAKEETAAAQRAQLQQRRKTNFLLSRQQSVAAASGLGALDPSVLQLAGDVTQEGAYQEGLIKYGGENRARGLRGQAAATEASGQAQQTGSYFSAAGSLASGFGSLFNKYGMRFPDDNTDPLTDQNGSYYYGSG